MERRTTIGWLASGAMKHPAYEVLRTHLSSTSLNWSERRAGAPSYREAFATAIARGYPGPHRSLRRWL